LSQVITIQTFTTIQSFHFPTYTCLWNNILQPKFCMCPHPIRLILLHQITAKIETWSKLSP
jgi:hypothetical protein